MKFIVMSDIHYISREMLLDKNDERMLMPAMCEAAFEAVAARTDIDTVLITGDLTNDGDMTSTLEVIALLKKLEQSGKKIYVLTATHDFHHNNAWVEKKGFGVQYKESPWHRSFFDPEKTDFRALAKNADGKADEALIPPLVRAAGYTDLWSLYKDFGVNRAVSVCESGYSYCVDLDEDTRCLMLNDCFRDEESRENVSPTFSPECFSWIDSMIKQAKKEGKFIFACTHHPFVPPMPAYKLGAGYRNMREPYPGHVLADMGLTLIFTGHSHFCDVGYVESPKGNRMTDITTPSVCHYPPQYRLVTLNGKESKIKLEIQDTPIPENISVSAESMKAYLANAFVDEWRQKVSRMPAPINTLLPKLTVKNLYPLCRKASKLTASEYSSIKDMPIFDILMALTLNLQAGDGKYTPDTPLYKFMMGLSAAMDDVITAMPVIDVRRKYLKGYSIGEIIEPMLFNNYIPDGNAEFDFTRRPEENFATPVFTSHFGFAFWTALYLLFIPASLLLTPAALISLPALSFKARKDRKLPPPREQY